MSSEEHSPGGSQTVRKVVGEQLETLSSSGRFNRTERRRLARSGRHVKAMPLPPTVALQPEEQILMREDDLPFLTTELKQYKSAQSYTLLELRAYTQLRRLGITDVECKKVVIHPDISDKGLTITDLIMKIGTKDQRLISNLKDTFTMMADPQKNMFYDPDEENLIDSLVDDNNINGKDILEEIMRARQESIDLMKMQIDWLKERQVLSSREARIAKKTDIHIEIDTGRETEEKLFSAPLQNVPGELPEAGTDLNQEVKEQFLLKGWHLSITKSPWSSDFHHLTNIPTNSRQEALDAVAVLTQGEASIKPNSILNALEFHLRRDVIQRALATRLKYGPDGIRDWVKIKRGDDRIFLFIPNFDEKRAIFFVEGRDVIYRSI